MFTLTGDDARVRDHPLRISGQRAAGVAAARAARLPEHVREARRRADAGGRDSVRAARAATAGRSRASPTAPGPIFAGKIFPFCFITIACGAISGFHSLISSGTTPKMIAKEWHAWPVGYGSMLLESFVAIMAMIAACVLQPGVYFAVNSPAGIVGATPDAAVATITLLGLPGDRGRHERRWPQTWARQTLFYRTGGAPSLALGMAHIFAQIGRRPARSWASGITSPSCSRRCSS